MRGSVVKPICKRQAAWPGGLGMLLSMGGAEVGQGRAGPPSRPMAGWNQDRGWSRGQGRIRGQEQECMCLRVRAGLTAGRVEPEGHLLEATWLPLAYSKTVPKGYFFLIVFFFLFW